MKVAINKCYGGFGLSPAATKRYYELHGRECYFFNWARDVNGQLDLDGPMVPLTLEQANKAHPFHAYDVPTLTRTGKWREMTVEEKTEFNKFCNQHSLETGGSVDRADPKLIQVIEELGPAASGEFAKLGIVEIPDGIEYEIEEYDGIEHIAEAHRTWE